MELRARLKTLWETRRRAAGFVLVAAALGLAVLVAVAGRGPRFAPLFTGLEARDAADIVAQLEQDNVPYRLTGNGRTIEVPEPMVYRTRLALAQQGLPRNGVVGFEIMDRGGLGGLGATDFDKRVQYRRALEGELTRTIQQIEAVEAARVHLNIPEPTVFVRDRKPASAAILLRLRPGATLDPAQVRGITHLVAATVEGLRPEAVTVLDDGGRLLTALLPDTGGGGAGGGAVANNNLLVQQEFQKTLERSLQTLLEAVLGPGNVLARVAAELNFDSATEVQELFRPVTDGQGILQNLDRVEETFRGTGGAAAPAGIASNTIPTMPAAGGEGTSEYNRSEDRSRPVLDRISKQISVAPGAVKRLSVSVVVNKSLSAEQEEQLRRLVTAAVGLDASRSDQISVIGLPFDTSLADAVRQIQEQPPAGPPPAGPSWLRYAVWGGAALLVLLSLIVAMRLGGRRARLESSRLAQELEALQQRLAQERAAAEARKQQAVQAAQEELQSQVANLARQRPEEVAQIIRSWLSEE